MHHKAPKNKRRHSESPDNMLCDKEAALKRKRILHSETTGRNIPENESVSSNVQTLSLKFYISSEESKQTGKTEKLPDVCLLLRSGEPQLYLLPTDKTQ